MIVSRSFPDYPHPAESVPFPLPDITHPLVICVGLVLLLLALLAMGSVCSFLRARQRKAKVVTEAHRQCPPAPTRPHFASEEHAEAVFLHLNRQMYQVLLTELRSALHKEGFGMLQNCSSSVFISIEMQQRIADRLIAARQRYWTMHGIQQSDKNADPDEGVRLCSSLIMACIASGWYVVGLDRDDIVLQAYNPSSVH
jgi:hypothetical protein